MLITSFFTHDDVPALGLSATIDIWELNVSGDILVVNNVSMTEIGGGFYKYNFTTIDINKSYVFQSDGGSVDLDSRYTFGATEIARLEQGTVTKVVDQVWDETATDHVNSGSTGLLLNQTKADTSQLRLDTIDIINIVTVIQAYHENRTKIDDTAFTLTVYQDDGITPLRVFDLKDENGIASITSIFERIPQ